MRRGGQSWTTSEFMSEEHSTSNIQHSTPKADFAEAREVQWMWKTPAMEAMAVAVCKLALERGMAREFSANDLPEFAHGGQGIAGAIFKRLIEDQVLTRVGMFDSERKFQPKIVTNAGGNKIGVYRLASHARASAMVRLHSARADARPTTEEFKQAELME